MAEVSKQTLITETFRQTKGFFYVEEKREGKKNPLPYIDWNSDTEDIPTCCKSISSPYIFEHEGVDLERDWHDRDILEQKGDFSYPSIFSGEFSGPFCVDLIGARETMLYVGACVLSSRNVIIPCPTVRIMCTIRVDNFITFKGPCFYDEQRGMVPNGFHSITGKKFKIISIDDDTLFRPCKTGS